MLTDPRLYRPINRLKSQLERIEQAAQTAEDYNDPRSTTRGSGSGAGGPGRQQAEAMVKRMSTLIDGAAIALKETADMMDKKAKSGHVHEGKPEAATCVGGKDILTPESDTTTVMTRREGRIARHLAAKLEDG